MAAVSTLKIVMNMTDGKTHTVSLKDPANNVSLNDVETFVDLCAGKTAFKKNNATAVGMNDAYIQRNERIDLE